MTINSLKEETVKLSIIYAAAFYASIGFIAWDHLWFFNAGDWEPGLRLIVVAAFIVGWWGVREATSA